MSQPAQLVLIVELSYAAPIDEGDVEAERALIKGYRVILILGSFATIAWLSRMCWITIARGSQLSHVLGLLYANGTALLLAYFCLRAFRLRSRWLNSLLWVSFFLWLVAEIRFVPNWQPIGWFLFDVFFGLLLKLPLALFLLCYPLLCGRPTEAWIRRLTYLSIATFALYGVPFLYDNLTVIVLDFYGYGPHVRFYPMSWFSAGMVVSAAILFLFRDRLNRVVLCGVAAFYLYYASQDLLFNNYAQRGLDLQEYLSNVYFQKVAEFLKKLAAGLPIAMLVWFAFRFDAAARRALARAPSLADRALNA